MLKSPKLIYLILVMLLLGSTLLIINSCATSQSQLDGQYKETLKTLVPESPVVPDFPLVTLEYIDGNYCLSETAVDKLLVFRDQELENFKAEYELYIYKINTIIDKL